MSSLSNQIKEAIEKEQPVYKLHIYRYVTNLPKQD